jgi:hypothetical protein
LKNKILLIYITALILYLTTLAPSVVTLFDDSLEFQLVTYQLGIAHPTGYPLYTILGKLFTFIPVGNVAFRVNLMSAVFGAATVTLVYLLIVRCSETICVRELEFPRSNAPRWNTYLDTLHRPHVGGIIGATLFAISPVFWQQATIAEVYTLNSFFVSLILLVAVPGTLTKLFQKSLAESQNRRENILGILVFLIGLSLTHHRTIILLIPALVAHSLKTVLQVSPTKSYPKLPKLLLFILVGNLPLLLYLYLPLRGHIGSLDGTYQNTWAGFWQQVTASGYGSSFILDNPFGQKRSAIFYAKLLIDQFGPPVLFGFIGWFYLLRRKQYAILILTTLAFITYTIFNIFYNVADIEPFFIPVFLIWAIWMGIGIVAWLDVITSLTTMRTTIIGLTIILLAGHIFYTIQQNRLPILERNSWRVHDYGLDILQQPLPENATIVGIVGEMTLIRYFQQTEGFRPDVQTIAADAETERLAVTKRLLDEGKSVYLTRELPGAPTRWSLSAVGPLIRVDPNSELPTELHQINQTVTPQINMVGYHISHPPHTGEGQPAVRLTTFWQVTAPISTELKVSARLLNQAGEIVSVVDTVPVHFAYPTIFWRPGEIVTDVYDLQLPTAGEYTPLLIWYDPAQNAAEVGRIELAKFAM